MALAEEGWSNRIDISVPTIRRFIEDLRDMVDIERHRDVRTTLISIVAHLCKDEPWTRNWVLQKAKGADKPCDQIAIYAIGLSAWNTDETFIQALNSFPKDSVVCHGDLFVQWAKAGDWKRYRFHMGCWGPKM
jgi:hypothetical protein